MGDEQVIQEVVLEDELDALVKLLRDLLSPTLQLSPQCAPACQ